MTASATIDSSSRILHYSEIESDLTTLTIDNRNLENRINGLKASVFPLFHPMSAHDENRQLSFHKAKLGSYLQIVQSNNPTGKQTASAEKIKSLVQEYTKGIKVFSEKTKTFESLVASKRQEQILFPQNVREAVDGKNSKTTTKSTDAVGKKNKLKKKKKRINSKAKNVDQATKPANSQSEDLPSVGCQNFSDILASSAKPLARSKVGPTHLFIDPTMSGIDLGVIQTISPNIMSPSMSPPSASMSPPSAQGISPLDPASPEPFLRFTSSPKFPKPGADDVFPFSESSPRSRSSSLSPRNMPRLSPRASSPITPTSIVALENFENSDTEINQLPRISEGSEPRTSQENLHGDRLDPTEIVLEKDVPKEVQKNQGEATHISGNQQSFNSKIYTGYQEALAEMEETTNVPESKSKAGTPSPLKSDSIEEDGWVQTDNETTATDPSTSKTQEEEPKNSILGKIIGKFWSTK